MNYIVTWIVSWGVIGFLLYRLTIENNSRGATSPIFVGIGGGFIGSLVFMIIVAMIWPVNGQNEQAGNQANVSQEDACTDDWHKCADNGMLVNHWKGVFDAKIACEQEADNEAKYGHPTFSLVSFSTYVTGKSYLNTGLLLLEDDDSTFQNGFGAAARVQVQCLYDLNNSKVVDMSVTPR